MGEKPVRTVPPLLAGLVDDAAIFPPGNAPTAEAVQEHDGHAQAWYAGLVGPFLCTDRRLPELGKVLGDRSQVPARRLPVGVVVTGGAGAIGPAVTWAGRDDRLSLVGVEIMLRDEPDLAHNARRVAAAVDAATDLPPDATVSVEVPRTPGWESALDVLAESGHRAKFRTGGPDPEAVPSDSEIARFVLDCLDREVPFKCTAGLHRAVRGSDHHGFLNILLATRAALDGSDENDLVRVLADPDGESVAAGAREIDDPRATSTRRWFTSFGSCSVSEPLADLIAFGLLEE